MNRPTKTKKSHLGTLACPSTIPESLYRYRSSFLVSSIANSAFRFRASCILVLQYREIALT